MVSRRHRRAQPDRAGPERLRTRPRAEGRPGSAAVCASGASRGLERVRCFYLYPNTLTDSALDAMRDVATSAVRRHAAAARGHATCSRRMRRAKDTDALRRLIDRMREQARRSGRPQRFHRRFPGETERPSSVCSTSSRRSRFDHIGRVRVLARGRQRGRRTRRAGSAIMVGRVSGATRLLRLSGADRRGAAGAIWSEAATGCWSVGRTRTGAWFGRTEGQAPEIDGVTCSTSGDRWSTCCGRSSSKSRSPAPKPTICLQTPIPAADSSAATGC